MCVESLPPFTPLPLNPKEKINIDNEYLPIKEHVERKKGKKDDFWDDNYKEAYK